MKYMPKCLASIRNQTYKKGYEIIVVNNMSNDGSLEYLRTQKDVKLIDPGFNTGFSKGQNLGIHASRGEYVLCLNFDCFLEPGFLEAAARVFDGRPDLGSLSGKLKKLIDHEKSDFLDTTGISYHRCFPADRGEWCPDQLYWNQGDPIFGPSGAAALYRRSALEDVRFDDEYFDEDMFIYCEDIDLAWRLNLAGWNSWYEPSAVAYHERGSTRKDSSSEKRNYFLTGFRNRLLGLYKNLRYKEDIKPYWPRIIFQEIRFILAFARGGLSCFFIMMLAIFKAIWKIIFCPKIRRKRNYIQNNIKNHNLSLGFDQPLKRGDAPMVANLYDLHDYSSIGKTLCQFNVIEQVNIIPRQSRNTLGAIAYGTSVAKDPQFIVSIPEHIRQYSSQLLEFEFYSSLKICGQIIWFNKSDFCISESFTIHAGRKRYLIDFSELRTIPSFGTPVARINSDRLRIDPTDQNGVEIGIFSLKIIQK
jgi:GT2 family glycosyltransferase